MKGDDNDDDDNDDKNNNKDFDKSWSFWVCVLQILTEVRLLCSEFEYASVQT
jgi:hypothetical protein